MGFIGHEVNAPASSLAAAAISTLYQLRDNNKYDIESLNKLNASIKEIKTFKREMGRTMENATLMAERNQRLFLKFRNENLYTILKRAKNNVENTFMALDPNDHPRQFRINISESCKNLFPTICDRESLVQVFSIIFKNAAKFSIPPYNINRRERIMNIDVTGLPQSNMNIIQIKNWGIGIPTEDFENIFRPFYRINPDKDRAVKGMGLGLYIARAYMFAHKGKVYCHSSTPTHNNIDRIKNLEGFSTMFEIRIPLNLKLGIKQVKLEGLL